MTNEQKAVEIAQESVINVQPFDFASVEYGALKMAKWKDEIKVQSNDIKWRKRSEKGYDGEMGVCQMQGVGYVVYTETHYIPWEELEKLPKE